MGRVSVELEGHRGYAPALHERGGGDAAGDDSGS